MGMRLNKLIETFNQSGGILMFIRAQLSAQVATIADFLLSIALNQLFGVYYVYATFFGALTGGLINCTINYKWTFHTDDCRPAWVMFKYVLVWSGSIALNTFGTYLLTEMVVHNAEAFGIKETPAFIFSKIVVAVAVAVLWNYNLHRKFVFRDAHIKGLLKDKMIKSHKYGNKGKGEGNA